MWCILFTLFGFNVKGQNFKKYIKTRKVIKKWKSLENFSLYLNDFTFIYFFLKVRLIN